MTDSLAIAVPKDSIVIGKACEETNAVLTGVALGPLWFALCSSGIFKYTTTPVSNTTPMSNGDKENREDITFPIGKSVPSNMSFYRKYQSMGTQVHKNRLFVR